MIFDGRNDFQIFETLIPNCAWCCQNKPQLPASAGRVLTYFSIDSALCPYRFFYFICFWGGSPSAEGDQRLRLWTPQTFLYKSLTKNFSFCCSERSRRQATCARARLFHLHSTDNANRVQAQPAFEKGGRKLLFLFYVSFAKN